MPAPARETNAGRKILAENPDTPGSLGIAISEAIEQAVTDPTGKTRYSLGSVLNHVMLHQTIIGLEAKKQLEMAGEKLPDIVIGCAGGGSNFAGLSFPFTADKINGADIEIIPVEPAACPTLTRAPFHYDFGDTACTTPLLAMHTLGHAFVPPPIHAGGLRYHGMAPLVCQAIVEGLHTPRSYHQTKCYESALLWAKHRRHDLCTGNEPRDRRRDRRGREGPRRGQRKGHPVQLQWSRPDGPDRIQRLLVGQALRLRASGGRA